MSDPRVYEWIAVAIVALTILVMGYFVYWYIIEKVKARSRPKPRVKISHWFHPMVIGVVCAGLFMPNSRKPYAPALAGVLAFLGIAFYVGFAIFREYDRDANRAIKRAISGDVDGAIAELRDAMDGRRPSAIRSNAMGTLLSLKEEWAEAYKWFLGAEAIGGRRPYFLGNQALMLWKMGRAVEAAKLLEEATSRSTMDVTLACNYGLVLGDLGRLDEASHQLALAEEILKMQKHSPTSQFANQVDQLRKKLEGEPASRDQATFNEP